MNETQGNERSFPVQVPAGGAQAPSQGISGARIEANAPLPHQQKKPALLSQDKFSALSPPEEIAVIVILPELYSCLCRGWGWGGVGK